MATELKQKNRIFGFDFNPDLFNNIYWHLLAAFNNVAIRFIWVFGGSSASKTYSVVQLVVTSMLQNRNENTMVIRKYAVDIYDSIYTDFKTVISDFELTEHFIIQVNYIECKLTGSYVRFRGLDDSEKLKGLAGFKRVILEEISQFVPDDFKQVRKRLRGAVGQQIIGIFNPVSEEHWIKKDIFDKEELLQVPSDIMRMEVNAKGNLVIMKTNYLDNRYIVGPNFVDQHTIDDFEKDKIDDFEYYRIYGLGDWGKLRTGGEFWRNFNANKQIRDIEWVEDMPLQITWDENVNPYITCLVWQIFSPATLAKIEPEQKLRNADRWKIPWDNKSYVAVQIDEICLEDPRNRVKDACMEFEARYPRSRVQGLFIYGDRTSVKEDTKLEKGENFFTIIQGYLGAYKPTLRMQLSNPSVAMSGNFINECYNGSIDIQIYIHSRCKKSTFDYQYALIDGDGTIKKTKVKNPKTKVMYEEFGHPSDAKRYILTVAFAQQYETYLRGGKKTLPSTGKNRSNNTW